MSDKLPNGFTASMLPPGWRQIYEERAAIMEFDGGATRNEAEAAALRETYWRWQSPVDAADQ